MSDHDPFNEPDLAHTRARELMIEPFFWDCVDEFAPFGCDEGCTGYYEWRKWREDNPSRGLKDCLSWILDGKLDGYTDALFSDARVKADLESPNDAFLADHYDMFTLDTTIIATALGQLMDEGVIDSAAKPYAISAVTRQLHPRVCKHDERRKILEAVKRVVEAA